MIMNSFLDSNVIIGYIFCLDPLFDLSKEFIFKSENNFYSPNVKLEVEKVHIKKGADMNRFFSDLFFEIEIIMFFNLLILDVYFFIQ